MAATAPAPSGSTFDRLSLSNFVAKIKSRRKQSPIAVQDTRSALIPSPLPLVLPEHQPTFPQLGWTTVTFPQPAPLSHPTIQSQAQAPQNANTPDLGAHPLQQAYEDLFQASSAFFDLPDEEKERWKTKLGSEEGWSKIPGEKEFITLRTLAYTPDVLKEPARKYWELMGTHLTSTLGRIETSLAMPDNALKKFVGPCANIAENDEGKTATMLRLFRYEGWEEKVVAESHADLGLLSFVVGNVPGLEVWGGKDWVPIEKLYSMPAGTLLGGRQLQRLSNFRYPAGGHRVVSYGKPASEGPSPKYRFSIVFVLRAYAPVVVNSDDLETHITGKWEQSVENTTAGKMYEDIRNAHFNINTGMKEREEQRKKLDAKKGKGSG